MKRHEIALTLLIVAVLSIGLASAAETAPPVTTTLLSYQPLPAQPGDLLDVYIQVSNDGSAAAEQVQVELVGGSAFIPEGQTTLTAGTILAQSAYVAKFKVKVAPEAKAGERILTLRVKQKNTDWQERSVSITVQTTNAAVLLRDVKTTPSTIEPGKQATLSVSVENQDSGLLRDVTMEINLSDAPFVILGGGSKKKITSLSSGKTAQFTYTLATEPDATADVYSVPVTVTFLDETGNQQSQTENIGLLVNTEANTKTYLDEITRVDQDTVQVGVRIVNKGLSTMKFTEASIADTQQYHVRSQDAQVYVGNIDSDDWETIRFQITTQEKSFPLTMEYTYKDAFNQEHTGEQTFQIEVPEMTKSGNNTGLIIVVLIVLGIIGIVWWRKRRKKNR